MKSFYCHFPTERVHQIARAYNISVGHANNIVSAWQNIENTVEEPTMEQIKQYMETRKAEIRELKYALPVYEAVQGNTATGYGAFMAGIDNSTKLYLFPEGSTMEDLYKYIDEIWPQLTPYKDQIKSFKDFYTVTLYAAKSSVDREDIEGVITDEDVKAAIDLLSEYKRLDKSSPKPQTQSSSKRKEGFDKFNKGYTHSSKGAMGGKLASTNSRTGAITVATDVTVDEFFDYIQGKFGGATSAQKREVFKRLAALGYTEEVLRQLITTQEDVVKLLAYHEMSHVFNEDSKDYWEPGETAAIANYMTPKKLDKEFGATLDAIVRLQKEKTPAAPKASVELPKHQHTARMTYSYGSQGRANLRSKTTLEAIVRGERTATTRYMSDGNLATWRKMKVGDIVKFTGKDGATVLVRITKELVKLDENTSAEEWSEKEGWSVSRFEGKVKERIARGDAYQIEFEYIADSYKSKENEETSKSTTPTVTPASVLPKAEAKLQEEPKRKEPPVNDTPVNISYKDRTNVNRESPRAKMWREIGPIEYKIRIEVLARKFSTALSEEIDELIEDLQSKIANAQSEDEKELLETQLRDVTDPNEGRKNALNIIGFKKVVERVKDDYRTIAELSEEDAKMFYGEGADAYIAKSQTIIDNFDVLFEDCCPMIEKAENLSIKVVSNIEHSSAGEVNSKDAVVSDSSDTMARNEDDFGDDEGGKRATGNDGWSFKVRFVDPRSTLSSKVKAALSDIVRVDAEGNPILTDLGETRYYDADYIHSVLIDKMSKLISVDDFVLYDKETDTYEFPALEKLAKTTKWATQVINILKEDPQLISLFFSDMRNDFIPYWIHTTSTTQEGATAEIHPMPINAPVAEDSTLSRTALNYEQGIQLSPNSIYTKLGLIHKLNIAKQKELVLKIQTAIQEYEEEDDIIPDLVDLLKSLGFNVNADLLNELLQTDQGQLSIYNILNNASVILGKVGNLENGGNIIEAAKEEYKRISRIIGEVDEVTNITSARDGDRTRYSYSAPNYVNTLVKYLKDSDRRTAYIAKQFKTFSWFYGPDGWNSEWLSLIENDEEIAGSIDLKEVISIEDWRGEQVEYDKWTPQMIAGAFVREYFSIPESTGSEIQYAWYNFPIFSDSPVAMFIKFVRYTGDFEAKLNPLFSKIVKQELSRIHLVEERRKVEAVIIQNFDKVGDKFHFFPELNTMSVNRAEFFEGAESEEIAFVDLIRELNAAGRFDEIDSFIERTVSKIMEARFDTFINSPDGQNALFEINAPSDASKELALKEYFYNQSYATSQIIQLTTTDLAFYKDITDFQKRFKEIYAAGKKLNTNSKYGRRFERTIYLADSILTSSSYVSLKQNLFSLMRAGRLSRIDVEMILTNFRNINATNAQAFRSMSSFRSVLDMMGLWNDRMEAAVERFSHNEWSIEDFDLVWQTIKPFVYTQLNKPDGIGGRMKTPHQDKNSEFLLLATFSMIAGPVGTSPKLRALTRFMEDFKIDVAQFQSAVKAGGQGIIDINFSPSKIEKALNDKSLTIKDNTYAIPENITDIKGIKKYFDNLLDEDSISQDQYTDIIEYFEPTEEEVYNMLKETTDGSTKLSEAMERGTLTVNGETYTLPEGMRSKEDVSNYFDNLVQDGTISKRDYEDIMDYIQFDDEIVHTIANEDYVVQQPTPEHLFDAEGVFGSQFRSLITADISDSTEIILPSGITLKDRDAIISFWQNLITQNLLEDYQKVKDRFSDIETLQAELKKLVSSNPKYGSDMLNALELVEVEVNGVPTKVFNIPFHTPNMASKIEELVLSMFKNGITKQTIKGGNAIMVSSFGLSNKLHVLRDSNGTLQGVECYLPFYTQKFFEPFMKTIYNDDGSIKERIIDVKKIEEQDSDLLKIIGYRIPTEDKYSMLPLVIKGFLPQQNGSAIMLPAEVTTITGADYDVDKIFLMIPEYNVRNRIKRKEFIKYLQSVIPKSANISRDDLLVMMDELENGKLKDYSKGSLERTVYDTFKAREDEFTELSIKKVQYDSEKSIEENSRRQRNNALIDLSYAILTHPETSEKFNNPGNYEKARRAANIARILSNINLIKQYIEEKGITSETFASTLLNESDEVLSEFIKNNATERDPLSPSTFIYFHNQNMTGSALIGVYAINTVMQSKFQESGIKIKSNLNYKINGRRISRLDAQYIDYGNNISERISKLCANLSAAAVDNAKDPVLADLYQNLNTAKLLGFMVRAGINFDEAAILLSNPIVVSYFNGSDGTLRGLLDELKKVRKNFLNNYGVNLSTKLTSFSINTTDLVGSYLDIKTNEEPSEDTLRRVFNAALMVAQMYEMSIDLADINSICRADSPSAAISSDLASAQVQRGKVSRVNARQKKAEYPFSGVEKALIQNRKVLEGPISIDDIKNNKGSLGLTQVFYSLGIDFGIQISSQYFKTISDTSNKMLSFLMRLNPRGVQSPYIIKKFYQDLVTFALSKSELFGDDGTYTYEQKRNYYIEEFPIVLKDILVANPDLLNIGVIRQLSINDKGRIVLERSGRLTESVRQSFMRDFDMMQCSDNEVYNQLAFDLMMYSYYADGMRFGPNSFGTFFSSQFISSVPELIDTLRFTTFNEEFFDKFLKQFINNNYYRGMMKAYSIMGPFLPKEIKALKDEVATIDTHSVIDKYYTANGIQRVLPYICIDRELYIIDPESISAETCQYTKVNTYDGDFYNANATQEEMTERTYAKGADISRLAAPNAVKPSDPIKKNDNNDTDLTAKSRTEPFNTTPPDGFGGTSFAALDAIFGEEADRQAATSSPSGQSSSSSRANSISGLSFAGLDGIFGGIDESGFSGSSIDDPTYNPEDGLSELGDKRC